VVLDKVGLLPLPFTRCTGIELLLLQNTVAQSNTVALDFGRALFGPIGGSVFAFLVAFSCFGALNGVVLFFFYPVL